MAFWRLGSFSNQSNAIICHCLVRKVVSLAVAALAPAQKLTNIYAYFLVALVFLICVAVWFEMLQS